MALCIVVGNKQSNILQDKGDKRIYLHPEQRRIHSLCGTVLTTYQTTQRHNSELDNVNIYTARTSNRNRFHLLPDLFPFY